MAIIALREIQKNEEITFHYNFVPFDGFAAQKCECKSEKCKGIIAQKNNTKSKEQFLTSLNLKSSDSNRKSSRSRKSGSKEQSRKISETKNQTQKIVKISSDPTNLNLPNAQVFYSH